MKKFRKLLAVLLIAVMALSLSACGSFEMNLARGLKKLTEYDSLHADVDLSMSYGVEIMGRSLDFGTDISYAADIQREPFKMLMLTDISIMGVQGTLYGYMESQGDSCVVAASADGDSWSSETIASPELPGTKEAAAAAAGLAKYLSGFKKAGDTEQINGFETQRYEGSISGSDLREILEITGGAEKLNEELDGGFELEMIDEQCQIPMAIWLDKKTGVINKAEAELGQIIEDIVRETVRSELELPEDAELSIKVSSALFTVRLSDFNAVEEIVSPLN